jgi:diguanylate cyclase (GGDEF)-like protein
MSSLMDRMHRLARRRKIPAEVASLGLLVLVASACCLVGVLFPLSDRAPVELGTVLTPIGFAVAVALLAAGARTPRWALHAAVAFVMLAACALISQSATNGGLMMTAWSLAWLAVYVAMFFSRPAVLAHVGAMTACLGIATVMSDVRGAFVEFVMMAVTLWAAALVLSTVSARLRAQADRDALTGLLNRNGFRKAAQRELAIAARTGYPLTLAVVDLDDFKRVNDDHGHAAGDRLLTELAAAWTRTLRPGDLVARFGGDEFVVLFPATGAEEAHTALARLRGAHATGWSVGVVGWDRRESLDDCLMRADVRLYEAKHERAAAASAG